MNKWSRLMGKLKKSSLFKKFYPYKVTTSKEVLLKYPKFKAFYLTEVNNNIEFYTTKKGILPFINDEEVEIKNNYNTFFKKVIKKNILLIISLLLIFVLFIISSNYIREISFLNPDTYDYDIYEDVKKHLKKHPIGYTLDVSVNELNHELRKSYPHFTYIGASKLSSKIIIEIVTEKLPKIDLSDTPEKGDIISLFDGYIVGISSKRGIVNVTSSQSVKKGDLLISGNLNFTTNPNDVSNYVHPDGLILGNVVTYEKIKVLKEQKEVVYSGAAKSYFVLSFLDKALKTNKKTFTVVGHSRMDNVFNIGSLLVLKKQTDYEKVEAIITYNEDEAIKYALSKVKYDFLHFRVSNKEYIHYINLMKVEEYDEYFEITFIMKTTRNMGKFQKLIS